MRIVSLVDVEGNGTFYGNGMANEPYWLVEAYELYKKELVAWRLANSPQ